MRSLQDLINHYKDRMAAHKRVCDIERTRDDAEVIFYLESYQKLLKDMKETIMGIDGAMHYLDKNL